MDNEIIELALNTFVEYSEDDRIEFIRKNMPLLKEISAILYESVLDIDPREQEYSEHYSVYDSIRIAREFIEFVNPKYLKAFDKFIVDGSFGNGAAMRISPVSVAINSIDKIKSVSAIITNVSHNHPDSISGAEAIAVTIRMALNGENKGSIKQYIESNYFKIDDLKVDTMKPQYFHINCVETVKQSLSAFFDSYDFEDAIRNAIALGGDSDTIGAITGSIAAAYYGIPKELIEKALSYLDKYLIKIHDQFNEKYEVK